MVALVILLLCSRCGKVVILNVQDSYQYCVIFAGFLSRVLGVYNSAAATPAQRLPGLCP